jgi:hypothetical protein
MGRATRGFGRTVDETRGGVCEVNATRIGDEESTRMLSQAPFSRECSLTLQSQENLRANMCEIHLYHGCDPEQSPKAPSAHRCLEHYNAEPSREGPNHSRIRVIVGIVECRPSRHALIVASEPEILQERWMRTSEWARVSREMTRPRSLVVVHLCGVFPHAITGKKERTSMAILA